MTEQGIWCHVRNVDAVFVLWQNWVTTGEIRVYFTIKFRLPASIPTVFTLSCLLFSALSSHGPMGWEFCWGIRKEAGHLFRHPIVSMVQWRLGQSATADVSDPLKTGWKQFYGAFTLHQREGFIRGLFPHLAAHSFSSIWQVLRSSV